MIHPSSRSPYSLSLDWAHVNNLPTLPQGSSIQACWQETLGWQPSPAQSQLFQQVYHGILLGNQHLNLTRITKPEEFWEKHLWDSLSGIRGFLHEHSSNPLNRDASPQGSHSRSEHHAPPECAASEIRDLRVIDIGSGAGFPGIPVAIAQPHWHITLLDSTRKKVTFLTALSAALSLQNIDCLVDRAEAVGQNLAHRDRYDLALLRAIAPAAVCVEYALPLLKPGGAAILYRGHWSPADTKRLMPALTKLNGKLLQIDAFQTPLTKSDRHCITIQKVSATPAEFPRPIGIPTQNPLA